MSVKTNKWSTKPAVFKESLSLTAFTPIPHPAGKYSAQQAFSGDPSYK